MGLDFVSTKAGRDQLDMAHGLGTSGRAAVGAAEANPDVHALIVTGAGTHLDGLNIDGGLNTIEFYSGDISANFATSANPQIDGGAQDNGPSSATFAGSPTGPIQWQMGTGGDGFCGGSRQYDERHAAGAPLPPVWRASRAAPAWRTAPRRSA